MNPALLYFIAEGLRFEQRDGVWYIWAPTLAYFLGGKIRFVIRLLTLTLVLGFPLLTQAASFGVGSYINSISSGNRATAISRLSELGAQWTRLEIGYSPSPDWGPPDDAIGQLRAAGVSIVLLVGYHDAFSSHDTFKAWIATLAGKYGGSVQAWEIFNEADNYLSGAAYADYLKDAHPVIKAANSGATVIASGISARQQATSFWNGLWDAGAGGSLDALGLHPYRSGAPETKDFNTGNFVDSIKLATSSVASHGGGKSVWLTEFGWRNGTVGDADQANHLARAFALAATVSGVDVIVNFNLYDNAEGGSYGVLNGDFSKKQSFGTVQSVIQNLKGKGFSGYIDASSSTSIANFESGLAGWDTKETSGGSLALAEGGGRSGKGMVLNYSFSEASGYAVAKRSMGLPGTPSGLSVWINASASSSVWKFRIKDAAGETFQFDAGSSKAGWNQYTFDIANDKAQTSWGGNGGIDFPVSFDSIVLDNQGGSSSGSATVDDITAITGGGDLYALKFGSTLAYWKLSGTSTSSVCGQNLTFTQTPQFATVGECEGASTSSAPPSTQSTTSTKSSSKTATAAKKGPPSKDHSKVSLDKATAFADGRDTMNLAVQLKDASGNGVESHDIKIVVSGEGNEVVAPTYKDGTYTFAIRSKIAGKKEVKAFLGEVELSTLPVQFKKIPESVTALEVPPPVRAVLPTWPFLTLMILYIVGVGVHKWRSFRAIRTLSSKA